MYKKILVAIDPAHIEEAQATLDLIEEIRGKDTKVILLSVVEELPSYVASQIPSELLLNAGSNANDKLSGLVERRGMDADIMVRSGHAATEIKAVQQEVDCDLIVISSHKPTTVDYVLGSTASKVVRRAQCSVLVTR